MVFKRNLKNKMLIGTMVLSLISVNPVYSFGEEKREVVDIPSGASFYHKKMIGKDRYETSNKILKEMGDKNETVILVNASEIMSDGLSASALAGRLKANIIPINPKKVNKDTMEIVKKAKEVFLIGGYDAIPKSFESNLKNKKVVRIGGKDRVETSEKIANYVGDYKNAYIVNGYTGQADAMSISPVAARDVSPIILTKKSSSEVAKKDNVEYTIIGGEKAVSSKIQKRFSSKRIDGKDRYETNRNVLKKFYPNRKSVSFCNGETLVDALSGTVYAKNEGIALVNRKNNLDLLEHISTSQLGGLPFDVNFVYGGSGGIGGSSGSGGGTGGGTVVTNKAPSKPEISANPTNEYNTDETMRKVLINITKESKDPEGDKVTYEYEGKSANNFYEVGKNYTVKVRAKDSKGKYSEYAEVTFKVTKDAVLLGGNDFKDKFYEFGYLSSFDLYFKEDVDEKEFEKIENEKSIVDFGVKSKEIIGYLEKDEKNNNNVYIISKYGISTNADCSNMFNMLNVKNIYGIEDVDTSNTTNMHQMFRNCNDLTSLDLSNFNTSNVTNMFRMFCDCNDLTSLDLSNFNTSKVENMSMMFDNCSSLTSLKLSNFNTSKVTDMSRMFSGCKILPNIEGLSKFDTSEVTNMRFMFGDCNKLTSLNLSNFKTINVENMCGMFSNCSSVTSIEGLSKFNTITVKDMSRMFSGCGSLTSIEELNKFNTINVEDMSYMFAYCSGLTSIEDLSKFNTINVKDMSSMFSGCSNLTSIKLTGLNTSNVTNMYMMFKGCSNLTSVNLSGLNISNVKAMSRMFEECTQLQSVDFSGLNMSNVTDISDIFKDCSNLKSINLSEMNMDNVTDMSSMFENCSNLEGINLSNVNANNVTTMHRMFFGCSKLTSVDLRGIATNNLEDMSQMFMWCPELINLDLSSLDTSKVINMSEMFICKDQYGRRSKLETLNITNWDTSAVENTNKMFFECEKLTTIYGIEKFSFKNVTDMGSMFQVCNSLKAVINIKEKAETTCNTQYTFDRRVEKNDETDKIIIKYNDDTEEFILDNLKDNNREDSETNPPDIIEGGSKIYKNIKYIKE